MANITALAGKTLSAGERVEVYFNLHKGKFSIKSMDKRNPDYGRVVAHASNILLEGATFHVSEAGLKRVLANKRKEVFAKIRGYLVHTEPIDNTGHRLGYCNPYKTGGFVDYETFEPLTNADEVYLYERFLSYKPNKEEA